MRFKPESGDDANNGLTLARKLMEGFKKKHPGASYADLLTFAGGVVIEEMGGPRVTWRPGRIDAKSGDTCPPVNLLYCTNCAGFYTGFVFRGGGEVC